MPEVTAPTMNQKTLDDAINFVAHAELAGDPTETAAAIMECAMQALNDKEFDAHKVFCAMAEYVLTLA